MSDHRVDVGQQDRAAAKQARVEQQAHDRAQVWVAVADRARRVDENTARLRALRLERERLGATASAAEAPVTRGAKAKSPKMAGASR